MKNLTAYSIFLLFLTLIFSCGKEVDIITESESEVFPQEGETRLITGIVRDTSGAILPQASVKIILGDLELETEADENGKWNLTIPDILTEGFVVANKVEYSKSVQRIKETEDNRVEDIYLAEEQSNTELDLSLNVNSLISVSGRIIDSNGNPISDVTLFIISTLESDPTVFNGFISTNEDGTFEIIYEDNGFSSSTLISLYSGSCSDYISVQLENQVPVQDLGDLELSYENFSVFQTTLGSDGSSCYETASTLAYNFKSGTGFLPYTWDQPLGEISLEYCPSETGVFYIGAEREDYTHFNGLFLSDTEVQEFYMFDICTPSPGNFLELNMDGDETIYEDLLYNSASGIGPGVDASQNTDSPLYFEVNNWATFTPSGSDNPAYQIGEIKLLTLTVNGIDFSLDVESNINYVNIVQDDNSFYAGIVQAKLSANDGSEAEIKIRFRVSK